MMYQLPYRRYAVQLIVFVLIAVFAMTAGAATQPKGQQPPPNMPNVPKNCDCELASAMMQKLAPYGVTPQDGARMVLHLSKGNVDGAKEVLAERGLKPDQIEYIEKNFAKEIEYGITSGAFDRLAGSMVEEAAMVLKVPSDKLPEALFALTWKDEDALKKLGLPPDVIKVFDTYQDYFGYDASSLDATIENRALRAALEQQGIKDLDTAIAAYYDLGSDAFDQMLENAGMDPEAFRDLVDQTENAQYKAMGFTDDQIEQLQQEAFLQDVSDLLGFAEELQDYLEDMGFDAEDAEKFMEAVEDDDLDAMSAILEENGIDADEADAFVEDQQEMEDEQTDDEESPAEDAEDDQGEDGSDDSGSDDSGSSDSGSSDSGSSDSGSSDSGSSDSGSGE